jgi:hypothetical protein
VDLVEKKQKDGGWLELLQLALNVRQRMERNLMPNKRTLIFCISPVDACTGNQDLIYDCEDTFTSYPETIAVPDSGIVQNGSFVEQHSSAMNIASKWYFIGMEVIEARSSDYLARIISQNVYNRPAVDVLILYQFLGEAEWAFLLRSK